MHKKRNEMPKNWPVARKGTKYFVVGNHSSNKGIPLVIILRDILGIVKTNRELRVMLHNKEIKINRRIRMSEKFPVTLFDVISIDKIGKHYRLNTTNKKMKIEEITEKEAKSKIIKIAGKTIVSGGAVQMNLEDGTNLISKDKFSVGDSAILDIEKNKINSILPLKEGSKVFITSGKHSGKSGEIKEIRTVNNRTEYLIKFNDGESLLPLKTIIVVN